MTAPVSIALRGGEYRFQRMLDIASLEMINDGTLAKILDKYDPERRINFDIQPQYKLKK